MSNQPPAALSPHLEQYKAYLADVGNIGSRYATSNGFYLSTITASLAVLALAKSDGALTDFRLVLCLAVPLFASLLCVVWSRTLRFYRVLFLTKFAVLREIESEGGLFHAYERERDLFEASKTPWLIRNEFFVPLLLALPFVVIFCYTLVRLIHRVA